ncbi:MAG: hypothetical protein LAD29_12460, partial [Rhodoferax sp.]|nr:hypothetical protein [Rhodoferax sp.]
VPGSDKSEKLFLINSLEKPKAPKSVFPVRRTAAKVHGICTPFPDQNKNINKINNLGAFRVNGVFIQGAAGAIRPSRNKC